MEEAIFNFQKLDLQAFFSSFVPVYFYYNFQLWNDNRNRMKYTEKHIGRMDVIVVYLFTELGMQGGLKDEWI